MPGGFNYKASKSRSLKAPGGSGSNQLMGYMLSQQKGQQGEQQMPGGIPVGRTDPSTGTRFETKEGMNLDIEKTGRNKAVTDAVTAISSLKKMLPIVMEFEKEFDRVFSIYIRLRDNGLCFTCGDKKYWKYQQNGHYVSRTHMSLRYDEENCNCQCMSCNVFRHGNMDVYAINLIKKHGKDILEKLNKKKNTIRKWSTVEMLSEINRYKAKILKEYSLEV